MRGGGSNRNVSLTQIAYAILGGGGEVAQNFSFPLPQKVIFR